MPNDAPAGTTAPVLPMLVRLRETGKQDGGEMLKLFDRLSADARVVADFALVADRQCPDDPALRVVSIELA